MSVFKSRDVMERKVNVGEIKMVAIVKKKISGCQKYFQVGYLSVWFF